MISKTAVTHFALLFLPLLIVCLIVNFLIELWSTSHPGVAWLPSVGATIVLDAILTFLQTRKHRGE